MKRVVLIISSCLFVFSCEYKDMGFPCFHGKVIMSSCCTGSTFISIENPIHIGKDTNLNGQAYSNVIQVPGYLTDSEVYLNLRKFDPNKDYLLFPPIVCECFVAIGMDVPIFVVTSSSTTACP